VKTEVKVAAVDTTWIKFCVVRHV